MGEWVGGSLSRIIKWGDGKFFWMPSFLFFCLWCANASEGYGYKCVLDLVKVILLLTQLLLKQPHG